MPSPNEYITPENLNAGSESEIKQKNSGIGPVLRFGIPILGIAFAIYLVWSDMSPPKNLSKVEPTNEEFRTNQGDGPSIDMANPKTDPGTIVIPEAPPPPPPMPPTPPSTIVQPPAPPAAAIDDGAAERARLAELERQRLAEEEKQMWERLKAPQIVASNGGAPSEAAPSNDTMGVAVPSNDAGESSMVSDDPNSRFQQSVSAKRTPTVSATISERTDALIVQGTVIRAVLETAIQSDLPGLIRATTTEDVWSFDGRRVLLPSGSRLVGQYRSGLTTGQTRVFIVWSRVIRPDGVSVQLASGGTDDLGRAGLTGIVDKHFFQRFGSAIMLSVIGGATEIISARVGRQKNNDNNDSTTTTTETKPDGTIISSTTTNNSNKNRDDNNFNYDAQQIAADRTTETINNMASEVLKDSLKIPPTIYVDQGARITVLVAQDLSFSSMYPDPVHEAIQSIKRERTNYKNEYPR